jgi:outer membrane lipoprotein carrier protein
MMLRGIAVMALVLASGLAQAADAGVEHLNGFLQGIRSMQAQFSQQTYDTKGKAVQTLSGEMKVKRPGYFRWETLKPTRQLIVTKGSTVWVYDPELEQATQQKLDRQVSNTPALLLSGDNKQVDAAFAVTEDAGNKGESVFTLRPKSKDAVFETLRVSFKGGQLLAMNLLDSLGQRTEIHFEQIKLNGSLADSLFEFTPPKGVDVINQ